MKMKISIYRRSPFEKDFKKVRISKQKITIFKPFKLLKRFFYERQEKNENMKKMNYSVLKTYYEIYFCVTVLIN